MPQSKEVHKEYMKRYRERQSVTKEYPGIVQALVDSMKRQKLERIHQSLKRRGLLEEVRYGMFGPTFEIVGELLEVTA